MPIVDAILANAQLPKKSQVPLNDLNATKAAALQDVLSAGKFEDRTLTEEEKTELKAKITSLTC